MDIHYIPGAEPTASERTAIDAAVASGSVTPRSLLLPALHAAQKAAGWVSPGALNHIARRLDVPPAESFGVASFYAMLSTERRAKRVIHVCDDVACRTAGSERFCSELEQRIGPEGATSRDGTSTWLRSPCLGLCERAPAALIQDESEESLFPTSVDDLFRSGVPIPPALIPQPRSELRLLRRIGVIDPESADDHVAHGGGSALKRALELGPTGVIREVTDSKLLGRGGAAFPTGRKWEAVASAPARPHYFVLNADESEPGTFKDRILMEGDPFAVIEALTIAGFAVGAQLGFLYVRGEYPLAARRLALAIQESRSRGWLGKRLLGSSFSFEVELRRGAGAYICGEETALFNSIEGFRGEPRQKPPFPVQSGLFGKPTAINNVESVVNVLDIVRGGGKPFASIGTPQSTGTKLFCVSGSLERPGLYEFPFGITLRELLARAGGVRSGRSLQAVLLGGAAGTFLRPDEIDVPLTFEGTRAIGAAFGSGVVMVFDDHADLRDLALRIAAFFRDESCGQCVPCRVGTVRQEESLRRLSKGHPLGSRDTEFALLGEIGQVMRDASICGLGQTASGAIASLVAKFPGLLSGAQA